jgi:hypothetical protein
MANLNDHLITPEKFREIKEVEITCDNGDTFKVGIRPKNNITWREKKKLSQVYFKRDMNPKDPKVEFAEEEGEAARYLMFIKYIIDDNGKQDITATLLEQLPDDLLAGIEEHILSEKEIISTMDPDRKKKLQK